MKYKVLKRSKNFVVLEHTTKLIIKKFDQQAKAHEYKKFLEDGGAFDGFTPSFIIGGNK